MFKVNVCMRSSMCVSKLLNCDNIKENWLQFFASYAHSKNTINCAKCKFFSFFFLKLRTIVKRNIVKWNNRYFRKPGRQSIFQGGPEQFAGLLTCSFLRVSLEKLTTNLFSLIVAIDSVNNIVERYLFLVKILTL